MSARPIKEGGAAPWVDAHGFCSFGVGVDTTKAAALVARVEDGMTFLTYSSRKEIALVSYEPADREKAVSTFQDAEATCLVTNSLVTRVEGEPEVSVRA